MLLVFRKKKVHKGNLNQHSHNPITNLSVFYYRQYSIDGVMQDVKIEGDTRHGDLDRFGPLEA